MRYEREAHYPLPLHDPAAVDFRAFYPYTPNEVKHRRRTTSAQLKVLEAVFRVDTKPNATLRNELAAQLGMTARGVQVWFQNRRAKEKNKANKKQNSSSGGTAGSASSTDPTTTNGETSPKDEDETDPASPPPMTPGEELLEELLKAEPTHDIPPNQHSQTNSPSPALASPPKLRVLTDPANVRPSSAASWKPTPSDESPPDSALSPSRPFLADIHSQRRGSLPANAFFHPFVTTSTHGPRPIDAWDPPARRRSVDTSLQRLGMHPYAQHARARNGALFGPHSPSQVQPGRQSSLSGKKSLPLQTRKPFLPHRAPPSHYLDMRRASMDPRSLMPSRTDGLSPSLSPRPLHAIRASLPDTSLFISSRRYVPQIPGPLPEPNFTFGAASVSPTDDEPSSPNLSSYSFPPRDDATEDDDMSSISFETLSRFGSAVSVATSESSVFSNPAFFDIGELAPDQNKRGSCGSTHLSCVTANLDGTIPLQSPAPVTADGYFDEGLTCSVLTAGVNLESQPQVDDIPPASSFTSPASTSTASPDGCSGPQLSTVPMNASVSNTSELASAFTNGSQNAQDSSSSFGSLDLSKQQQQLHTGSSLAQTPPPPNQQLAVSGHQTQAIDGSFCFDGPSEVQIDIAQATLESNPPITIAGISGQDVERAMTEQPSKNNLLHGEIPQSRGDFTAQFPNLMDGLDFGAALAMFDSGSTTSTEQSSRDAADCDSLVNLGLGVADYATSGVVAPGAYGAAAGIAPNQPTFAS